MPALVLVSTKGSPGVTTAAAALAAVATRSRRSLLVELDPAGGAVQVLSSGPAAWGLVDTAGQLRRVVASAAVDDHTTLLPAGVPSLVAPTAGTIAESTIVSAGDRWLPGLRAAVPDVVVDAGRWEPTQRTASRIVGADLVAVVCRPTVPGVESTRLGLERLVPMRRAVRPDEVAAHLDVPLGGMLAWDPRGAGNLWAAGVTRRWLRTRLARSAATTLAGLNDLAARAAAQTYAQAQIVGPPPAPPPAPGAEAWA